FASCRHLVPPLRRDRFVHERILERRCGRLQCKPLLRTVRARHGAPGTSMHGFTAFRKSTCSEASAHRRRHPFMNDAPPTQTDVLERPAQPSPTERRHPMAPEPDAYVLRLHIEVEAVIAAVAPDAARLHPAERRRQMPVV